MKAWRSMLAIGLLLAGLITSGIPFVSSPTVSAVGNCPGNEIQGSSATPGAEDTNKCYLKVQTSSLGNFEYRETTNKPATTNPPPDETNLGNDVDSCPAGTTAGYSGNPISGATNPRICYQPVQNGSAKPVARLTVAGQKAEEDKRTNTNNQNQNCPNGKNADGSCVENPDQDAIGDCGGGAMNWIICPVIQLAKAGAEKIDSFIMKSLEVDVTGIFETDCTDPNKPCTGKAYYAAWNSFRIIATAILVVAGLVMVISQALGFDFLDAYTMRKVLPRLVIAIIGISLSWPLMRFVVEFFNVLGLDIRSLMYAPFKEIGESGNIDPTVGIGTSIGLLAGGLILGGLGLLSLIATALLAVLVGFFVIVVRQIAIVMLVVVAPVAIACYILPNTEKVWKLWKDNFLGLMLMFPIISALIAAGHIFSAVSLADNSGGTATGANLVAQIVGIIAYFLPYFLLPLTFRLATGVIGTIAGFANDRGRGAFDRLKKYRGNKAAQNIHDMKGGNRFKGGGMAATAFNKTSSGIANLSNAGFIPSKMRSRMQAGAATHSAMEMAEYMDKNAAFAAVKGNDDYLQATMKNMGGGHNESDWRRYLQSKGYEGRSLEQGVAAIRAAKRATSNEVFERAAVMANASTGTGWKEGGVTQMMESINDAAGGDRHTANTMLAQMRSMASQSGRLDLAGSGFGTQSQQLERMFAEKKATGTLSAATKADVKHKLHANLLETKGANEFARARGQAVQQIAPEMLYDLQQAHAKVDNAAVGTTERTQAERELAQKYASVANLHDSLNHMAPENAKLIADNLLSQQVYDGDATTIMDRINEYRQNNDADFLHTRKDYDARQYRDQGGQPPDEGA